MTAKIAILGAGISGLATAHRLSKDHDVTVFEAGPRAGGNIRTERIGIQGVGDCLVEWGPNGFLDNEPAMLALVRELGLESRVVTARDEAARRMIWRAGRLHDLPANPRAFLTSGCLPLGARLRVLFEPFAKAAPPDDVDESIHAFASRRIGRAAADVLVDAFVTGVFAGDPGRLSVASAFPRLKKLELEYGSLFKGMKAKRSSGPGPGGTLTSFDNGLSVLIDELASRVNLKLNEPWERIEQRDFDRVICTVPAARAAIALDAEHHELAETLRRIPTAPIAIVVAGFREPLDVPEAFGFLVPHGQGLRILGTLYDSSIFAGRAPAGVRTFRTMIGGRRDAGAMEMTDDELCELAARELRQVWGTYPDPVFTRVIRHSLGIAQYEAGHAGIVARTEELSPGWLTLAGSSYRGVAINACVKEAMATRA
ncbi:MAG: protoporphyrinogen oxidase [Planctomycetota bacterium]